MRRFLASRHFRRLLALAVVVGIVLVGVRLVQDAGRTTIKVEFSSAEGLYPGDDVRVLGVRVGRITSVEPSDSGVSVVLEVDRGQPIPANAKAAIVSPSLVSGRFVQLSPVYDGGDRLEDGDQIGLERTAVPVTFDEVKQQLTDLSSALGPQPGDGPGALARTIKSIDAGLKDGNAEGLRESITELRAAAAALSDGRSDLFSTIKNLDTFTRTLAINDGTVRGFTTELDQVGSVLAQNRRDLTKVIRDLAATLDTTRAFLKSHGNQIGTSVRELNLLSAAIADRSNELAGILHIAPNAAINLGNIVEDRALTGRATLSNLDSAAQLICGAILGTGGTAEQCRDSLEPLLDLLGLDETDLGNVPLPNLPLGPSGESGDLADVPDILSDTIGTLSDLLVGSSGGG